LHPFLFHLYIFIGLSQRSTSFFHLLSDYNKNFVQVFIISPRVYQDDVFDFVISTSLTNKELIVSCDEKLEEAKRPSPEQSKEKESKESKETRDIKAHTPEEVKPQTTRVQREESKKSETPSKKEDKSKKDDLRVEYDNGN
jgi:hypothetical protein